MAETGLDQRRERPFTPPICLPHGIPSLVEINVL